MPDLWLCQSAGWGILGMEIYRLPSVLLFVSVSGNSTPSGRHPRCRVQPETISYLQTNRQASGPNMPPSSPITVVTFFMRTASESFDNENDFTIQYKKRDDGLDIMFLMQPS